MMAPSCTYFTLAHTHIYKRFFLPLKHRQQMKLANRQDALAAISFAVAKERFQLFDRPPNIDASKNRNSYHCCKQLLLTFFNIIIIWTIFRILYLFLVRYFSNLLKAGQRENHLYTYFYYK